MNDTLAAFYAFGWRCFQAALPAPLLQHYLRHVARLVRMGAALRCIFKRPECVAGLEYDFVAFFSNQLQCTTPSDPAVCPLLEPGAEVCNVYALQYAVPSDLSACSLAAWLLDPGAEPGWQPASHR